MFRTFLAALLLFLPATAHAAWHEASSAHFVVYSNDRPERIQEFATKLERFDRTLRLLLGVPDHGGGPASRLTVFVVSDIDEIQALIGSDMVAGFYRPRATGSTAYVPRRTDGDLTAPQTVLLHEYAHHFMRTNWPETAFPKWLVEGWAEFYGSTRFAKDTVDIGMVPVQRGFSLMEGNWLPIDKLLVAERLKLTEGQTEGLYGRGWLLTHYLINGGKRPGQLAKYIGEINQGKSSLEAAKVFGDLALLERELERYKRGDLTFHKVPHSMLPIGEVKVRALDAGEAAIMKVRIRSKNGVDEKTAPIVYADAKRAAAAFANHPAAQTALAEAAFDAKDYAGAEAAADRAIAADAKAIDAHIYKAMARMEVATAKGDLSKESWAAIRRSVVAANKIDPEDPEPLILYYRSFAESSDPLTKAARDGFFYAFELAPEDPSLRINVAAAYRADGNREKAKAILRPLAYAPHGGPLALTAQQMIAEMDGLKPEE